MGITEARQDAARAGGTKELEQLTAQNASSRGATAADSTSVKSWAAEQARIAEHLANFDDLDFRVFTGRKWAELHKSHSHDITVHWPDGHSTKGIETHIEDLKAMFVWAPDTRIEEHPVRFDQGDWTAVIGPWKDGVMVEEYLFWDNQEFMKQIGLGQ